MNLESFGLANVPVTPRRHPQQEVVKDFDDVLSHLGGWGRFQVSAMDASVSMTTTITKSALQKLIH